MQSDPHSAMSETSYSFALSRTNAPQCGTPHDLTEQATPSSSSTLQLNGAVKVFRRAAALNQDSRNQENTSMTTTSQSRSSFAQHLSAPATENSVKSDSRRKGSYRWLATLILFLGFTAAAHAQQYYDVDCSGANPNDYPTISSALANVTGPGAYILIMGTCTENVTVNNAFNINIGAWYGQTANLTGSITVNASDGVMLYGLNVTNPSGNGFTINSSHAVTLVSCSSNSNQLVGVNAGALSDVTVVGPSSFDHNGTGGLYLSNGAVLEINDWQGPTDISNNQGPGVWLSGGALFNTLGTTTILNNSSAPNIANPYGTYGVVILGAGKAQIGTCYGPNVIQGNQEGGIFLQENSELSLWNCGQPYLSYVLSNGTVGISAGFGSQVTLYEDVQISGHTGSGVELYGKSQLNINGNNLISGNGTAGNPRSAGIVVDGNSEAYLRGGQVTSNQGPGILALVNSSADFTGATFTGNSGGIITCDSSSYMASDLSTGLGNPSAGILCTTPHSRGNRRGGFFAPTVPDSSALKGRVALYQKMASGKPH